VRPLPVRVRGAPVAILAAIALPAAIARAGSSPVGTPPPEWAANAGSWPSHDFDLVNTRATVQTRIDARDVATLKKRWAFKLPYAGSWGSFTSC
jgi:hypothetical protein